MDYGKSNKYEMFQRAYDAAGGDCSIYNEANKEAGGDDYIPCAYTVMEVWLTNVELLDAQEKGVAELGQFMGVIGFQSWHSKSCPGQISFDFSELQMIPNDILPFSLSTRFIHSNTIMGRDPI